MGNRNSKEELMKKIQQLAFVKTELELFLDTHPNSEVALENYADLVEELNEAREEYAQMYGPISADESHGGWTWVEGSWPWHGDFPSERPMDMMNGEGQI